jgi:dihydropteroate synthase-like protein
MAPAKHYHFVTGRLAETALRRIVGQLSEKQGFRYSIQVLPITVAALMTADWISKRLNVPQESDYVMLPGYTSGELEQLRRSTPAELVLGPKDLRDLPRVLGVTDFEHPFGEYSIEILAEINHAPRQSIAKTIDQARTLRESGADIIDVGCDPGQDWQGVGDCVRALCDEGMRVSIDSLQVSEIERAVDNGAELVLSVNADNRHAADDWDAELVAIPDSPRDIRSLDRTIEYLQRHGCRFRIDPILEPIGCGFAASIVRYAEARCRYPKTPMLMGIGNLTELTECDSTGVNMLLLGICQELEITRVLTTQVIHWAKTSVQECDIGRRLAHYAVTFGTPPKHADSRLVTLRDARIDPHGADFLLDLSRRLKDPNYRIFAEDDLIHIMAAGLYEKADDPFDLFAQICGRLAAAETSRRVDASHAFYLGFEMSKALIALTLGKQYRQDQALDWGYLTREEAPHRTRRPDKHNGE